MSESPTPNPDAPLTPFWEQEVAKLEETATPDVVVPPEYTPRVPDWLRDVIYYTGMAASAAMLIFPEAPVLVRVGSAITLVGQSLAKVYRGKVNAQ